MTEAAPDDRLYFRQLLSGRDFAKGDQMARQMVNFAYLIQQKAHDGTVPLTIVRAGKSQQIQMPVPTHRPLLIDSPSPRRRGQPRRQMALRVMSVPPPPVAMCCSDPRCARCCGRRIS